jgi:asparagine synthetase B (glutamine-hydrolysing)
MCGVLLVQSQSHMPLEQHRAALDLLARRGPDFTKYQWANENTFVAQSVLHITGDTRFYHAPRSDAFAYNGEIYDYRWHGNYSNDAELVYKAAKEKPSRFKYFEGTWAWCYANNNEVSYASDPQGEKALYQYQDNDLLIVCSDVAPILTYINAVPQIVPYRNKGWSMIEQTPWQGITRCEPGRLYRNGAPAEQIDSVWSWISTPQHHTLESAVEEFDQLWARACDKIRPLEPATVSYSGGIDSSLILHSLPELTPLAIDIVGKDSIVDSLNCRKVAVSPESWAKHYQQLIQQTLMPAQSWSHVGKWLIAQHADTRIIFTGLGADELFGGYPQYRTLEYNSTACQSIYSSDDHDNLWTRCVEAYCGDARQATMLMDYWYQVVGVDASGLDRLGGCWGKETRNPFLMKSLMKFALNLPWHLKTGQHSKPVLRAAYINNLKVESVEPKKGFAGHANDSAEWLGVDFVSTGDRHGDWQIIAQQSYHKIIDQVANQWSDQTTQL